jgi:DNA-binding CsgD family transcriptional regulator
MSAITLNPWGLTRRECEVMMAIVEHGSSKATAKALGVAISFIEAKGASARRKMNLESRVQAAVAWDRWARDGYVELGEAQAVVLTDLVVDLITTGAATNPDAMMPFCGEHSRQQVMVAVRNAAQRDRVHLIGRVSGNSAGGGQRQGIYAPGPRPVKKSPFAISPTARPVSSVFSLGAQT